MIILSIIGYASLVLVVAGLALDGWRSCRKLGSDWKNEFRDFEA